MAKALPVPDPWNSWLASLDAGTRQALIAESSPEPVPANESEMLYRAWSEMLSPRVREALATAQDDARTGKTDFDNVRYHAVECPDGELPVLRCFRNIEAVARYLGTRDDEDVSLWIFYGVHLAFTKKPRYLLDHDGITAYRVPSREDDPVTSVDVTLLDSAERQEDSFLGTPEFSEPFSAPPPQSSSPRRLPRGRPPKDADDEEGAAAD